MVDVNVIVGIVSVRVRCQIVFLVFFRHVIPVYPSQYTNDTDYDVACFWCSFADSDCAFCAGCQLRLRMPRSGMMHRGCGRPVRTLRTFCDDRAAPLAPVLHFLCAKEMTVGSVCVVICDFRLRILISIFRVYPLIYKMTPIIW